MGTRYFSNKIVKWYLESSRPLPWRNTTDAYKIWLSEVILQQTRVIQGTPYYHRFVEKYPSVADLARAPEQEVMRLWQGLGYYHRARNLHKCAQVVFEQYGGRFPETFHELRLLPGIGDYTAAAIASFAFGEKVAVVDGNVFRVLARQFGIDIPVNAPEGRRVFTSLAGELLPGDDPGLHNQAIMEFGALLCKPRNPDCPECPFRKSCVAYQQERVQLLPVKTPKRASRIRYFFYLVVEKNRSLLMKKRDKKDIWNGLFDFVLIERDTPVTVEKIIAEKENRNWFKHSRVVAISKDYKHVLTHQTIHCRFIHIKAGSSFKAVENDFCFYSAEQVADLPKPVLISRFLAETEAYT